MFVSLKIASRLYDFSEKVYVMGILNVTPDSFSDGGRFLDPERALEQALRLEEEGADFIDIGAESTRPQASKVPWEEEWDRLKEIFKKLPSRLKAPLSIDTRKAAVAVRACENGAHLLNDVSGFRFDPEMIPFLRKTEISAILMHNRGTPETMSRMNRYRSVHEEVGDELESRLNELNDLGISRERLAIDPGIGFAKVGAQNLELLSHLSNLKKMGRPILVGLSRKSFLDLFFGSQSPQERGVGTEVAHALAILKGANILRVHDVTAAKKTIRFLKEIEEGIQKTEG